MHSVTYHLYFVLHADWPTHPWRRSGHHGNNTELTKFHNVTLLMYIICNILCFAIATAISNFDSETCNTPPKRLWKGRAGKKCQDLRQCTLKVPCRCTKQCIIRIPQLHRIRIWTESWNLKDYDTRRAFMYQLIERKPAHGNNEHRKLDYTKYWIQKCWIIQKKSILKIL